MSGSCEQLRNCPVEYYNNCSNALIKCSLCSAGCGREIGKILYRPIDELNSNHPHIAQLAIIKNRLKKESNLQKRSKSKDPAKSRQIKESFRHEQKLSDKIVKQTVKSGAVFGDGDAVLLEGLLRTDYKRRFNTQSFSLSWSEYQKGLLQGVNSWTVTVNEKDGKEHTVVMLTLESFTSLLSIASSNS